MHPKFIARSVRELAQESGLKETEVVEYCESSAHIAKSPFRNAHGDVYYGTLSRLATKYRLDSGVLLPEVLPGREGIADDSASEWDVFICHASEDKEDFVRPLAAFLRQQDVRVWFDEFSLAVGDSLRRSIEKGLARSRFGVVVISPHFLRKEWPQWELDGLTARETDGMKVILPVWHEIDFEQVQRRAPILAGRLAVKSSDGVEQVGRELLRAMQSARAPEP